MDSDDIVNHTGTLTNTTSSVTTNNDGDRKEEEYEHFNSIEFCPAGIGTAQTIAKRIEADSGAALIIDYGNADTVSSSIRGIKDHQFVSALQEPGLIDLSADVDFKALKLGIDLIQNIECTNVIPPSGFNMDYTMVFFLIYYSYKFIIYNYVGSEDQCGTYQHTNDRVDI